MIEERSCPETAYDAVSSVYDSSFTDRAAAVETTAAFRLMRRWLRSGAVVDLGCGTGLMLEQLPVSPSHYTGVDVSARMLDCARSKFPQHRFVQDDMRCFLDSVQGCSTIVSAFGSFSYVMDPRPVLRSMRSALRPGGSFFVMAYGRRSADRPGYLLESHGFNVPNRFYTADELRIAFEAHGLKASVMGFGRTFEALPEWVTCPHSVLARAVEIETLTLGRRRPDMFSYLIAVGSRAE